jgi:hypothetical protein
MAPAIYTAFAAFAVVFLLNILSARVYRPKSEDKYVFLHYLILPSLVFIALLSFRLFGWMEIEQAVLAYLLYFVIASSWVASSPAIYASCPSLNIALLIRKNKKGTSLEDLRGWLLLKQNSTERIEDAVDGGLISREEDHLKLTPIGKILFTFFNLYRKALGLTTEPL